MTQRYLPRITAISLSCGVTGALLLLAGARWITPSALSGPIADGGWTARTPGWFETRGFLGPEVDPVSGRHFNWTGSAARLVFPALDRSQDHRLALDIWTSRPPGAPLPSVGVSVDATSIAPVQMPAGAGLITVDLPARPAPGARVTLSIEHTYQAGSNPQALGVMVDGIRLEPASGYFRPNGSVLIWAATAIALSVLGTLLAGARGLWGSVVAAGIVAGFTWSLLLDAAFIGDDVMRLARIGLGVAIAGLVAGLLGARSPAGAPSRGWPTAVGVVLGASAVKLAFFTHPQIALTDGLFQVHRAAAVHRGEYFFTSVTPSPGYEFPYAIALYVAAQPFWSWFPGELDLVNLLRGLAIGADALVGIGLYAAVRQQWQSDRIAMLAAAIWPLTRAPAMALGHANLTNLFGQGMFGIAMAIILWMVASRRRPPLVLTAAGVMLVAAFLSHFSTLSIGLLLLAGVAGALSIFGPPDVRRTAFWTLAISAAAFALSYVAYYSHFTALYHAMFTRVLSDVDQASATSMVAAPALKLQRWLSEDQFSNDYGLPGLPLFLSACLGAVWLVRAGWREGMTLALLAWAMVWAGCSAIGILSSVELRANLAATPMFVCLSAYGLGTLAGRSRIATALSIVWVLAIAWDGVHVWLFWLGR